MQPRDSHQPKSVEEHPKPSANELKEAFSSSIAVILAYEESTTPLVVPSDDPDEKPTVCTNEYENVDSKKAAQFISAENTDKSQYDTNYKLCKNDPYSCRALQTYHDKPAIGHTIILADECAFSHIFVLGANDELKRVVEKSAAQRITPVTFVEFSRTDAFAQQKDRCHFEIIGITDAILAKAAELANDSQCETIMFLSANQVRITPWHLIQLARILETEPDVEIATSWIAWLRRMPALIKRSFIERILVKQADSNPDKSDIAHANVNTYPPIPNVNLKDYVFGEERIDVNEAKLPSTEAFFSTRTFSALKALRMARRKEDDKVREQIEDLGNADKMLIDIACKVCADYDALLNANPALEERISAADELGWRAKSEFPIFSVSEHTENLVYLDSAASSQRFGCALDAQYRFSAYENANIYRGSYALSAQATKSFNEARRVIENFIGADRRQTVFTMNSTQSLNLVAQAWGEHNIKAGDVILIAISEHHSNQLPWLMLADRKGAQIKYIDLAADGTLDMNQYDQLLKCSPKLVCVAQISNVLGILNPIEEMAQKAHDVGARFVVDAAQSMPHIPIDVKTLGADFVAFSGHKLYGPFGVGGLWIAPDAFEEMDPLGSGGGAVSHVSKDSYYLRRGAIQYELGTPPIAEAIGLAKACEQLKLIGMDNVCAHDAALTELLMHGLNGIDFITVWGDHKSAVGQYGLVSFSIVGCRPVSVGEAFAEMGVAVRSGGHCAIPLTQVMGLQGTTRISFGVYTTSEDVMAAIVALKACGRIFGIE